MTAKQTIMLRCEFGLWKKARLALGRPASDEDRHALYKEALGYYKSSKDFTNAEMDKVLAALRVWSRPADLNAQLAPEEQETHRCADLIAKCRRATSDMNYLGDTRLNMEDNRARYVVGTCVNLVKRAPDECTSQQLYKVLGALMARVNRMRRKNPALAAQLDAIREVEKIEQPF